MPVVQLYWRGIKDIAVDSKTVCLWLVDHSFDSVLTEKYQFYVSKMVLVLISQQSDLNVKSIHKAIIFTKQKSWQSWSIAKKFFQIYETLLIANVKTCKQLSSKHTKTLSYPFSWLPINFTHQHNSLLEISFTFKNKINRIISYSIYIGCIFYQNFTLRVWLIDTQHLTAAN